MFCEAVFQLVAIFQQVGSDPSLAKTKIVQTPYMLNLDIRMTSFYIIVGFENSLWKQEGSLI